MPRSISELMTLVANITAIIAIGMMAFKIRKYIEDRISDALSKDEIIQKLSQLVKPDMVFDDHGAIIADRGASAFIQDRGIHVCIEPAIAKFEAPMEIRIAFVKHLRTAPLLTALDPDGVHIRAKRGEAHDWIYELSYTSLSTLDDSDTSRRYRLEIF